MKSFSFSLFAEVFFESLQTLYPHFQVSLKKIIILVAAALMALVILADAIPTPGPSGAITVYPIPQRPGYAPNPWVYPKPTTEQPTGR